MKKIALAFLPLFALLLSLTNSSDAAPTASKTVAPRPNVIIFFIDDLGYSDIEPFGSKKKKTPNLTKLAEAGCKFNNFYVASTACSPSRSSLLTGCYDWRVGMDGKVAFPHMAKALNPEEYTMAEMFRDAGYATGCFGKWHLGHLPGFLPPSHGFDSYQGIPYSNDMCEPRKGPGGLYPPLPWIKNAKPVATVRTPEDQSLLTEVTTQAALEFIAAAGKDAEKKGDARKPFFCYLPYAAVHLPRLGREEYLPKGAPKTATIPASYDSKIFTAHLKAQVEELDADVGKVVALLKKLNIYDNTLVLWLSDNGGSRGTETAPLRGGKSGTALYEGNFRTPLLASWPDGIPAGTECDALGSTIDLLPTFAKLAGGKLSEKKIDGKDISAVFYKPSNREAGREYIYTKEGAFRKGDWKLAHLQLFDLSKDIGERKNLAKTNPQKQKEMLALRKETARKIHESGARPHAQMPEVRPLVTKEEAKKFPSLVDYLK